MRFLLAWTTIFEEESEMNIYVVCMDSSWVRDSQMFDLVGLPDSELTELDVYGTENEGRWHDMEPTPFIAIIKAETENEACMKAAAEHRYDPRCLFAIRVSEQEVTI